MKKGSLSPYATDKRKMTLWLTEHHISKYKSMCEMFNQSPASLFSIMVDEMYYDPTSPGLLKTVRNTGEKVSTFFMRKKPHWGLTNERG